MRRPRDGAVRPARATRAVGGWSSCCRVAGCAGGPILANPPAIHAGVPATPSPLPAVHDPVALSFPADDGPHGRLTEWWYYTGHLQDDAGRRFGFEFVIFRAERGGLPVSWASHLALTDEQGGRFLYAQRSEIGPQVDASAAGGGQSGGFALTLSGSGPASGRRQGRRRAPGRWPAPAVTTDWPPT